MTEQKKIFTMIGAPKVSDVMSLLEVGKNKAIRLRQGDVTKIEELAIRGLALRHRTRSPAAKLFDNGEDDA